MKTNGKAPPDLEGLDLGHLRCKMALHCSDAIVASWGSKRCPCPPVTNGTKHISTHPSGERYVSASSSAASTRAGALAAGQQASLSTYTTVPIGVSDMSGSVISSLSAAVAMTPSTTCNAWRRKSPSGLRPARSSGLTRTRTKTASVPMHASCSASTSHRKREGQLNRGQGILHREEWRRRKSGNGDTLCIV